MTQPRSSLLTRRPFVTLGAVGAVAVLLGLQVLPLGQVDLNESDLSVEDAHRAALAGAITLVDIRRPDEWAATGIGEGAHGIDMRRDDFIAALTELAGPDRAAPVALICARGVRSSRLAARLQEAGFTTIINVPEGMLGSVAGPGWVAADLPVTAYTEG